MIEGQDGCCEGQHQHQAPHMQTNALKTEEGGVHGRLRMRNDRLTKRVDS